MANLFFSRDTKVYLETVTGGTRTAIWEIPVLNGYAFSQTTNSSTITLAEMSDATGISRRGQRVFNDSVSPSEWSFDVYVRPTIATTVKAVEEALWANFVANNAYSAGEWTKAVTRDATTLAFDFDDSNVSELGTFNLYFVLGGNIDNDGVYTTGTNGVTIYKLENCVVNEATINFEVDGITMISWSGMGGNTNEIATLDVTTGDGVITTGITDTDNYIRNRLTAMTATSSVSGSSKTYGITLTGGSLTFSNNISFLTPESLGLVNQPIGHVTGTRSISGSFTAYLDDTTNGSQDLLADLQGALTDVTNEFDIAFYVGGKTGTAAVAPGVKFDMGQCHLEIPTINNDDVIAVEVNFTALPTAISNTDEVTAITYYGI